MRHKQLRAFHRVAVEGSFTRAAERLSLTQPALTVQVRNLEKEYGVRLFDRQGHQVVLTDQGRELFDLTQQLFALEDRIRDSLSSNSSELTGKLLIGVDNPFVALPLIAEYQHRFPSVEIELSSGSSQQIWQDLLQERIDMALITEPRDDPRLQRIVLNETHLLVAAPATPEWCAQERISLHDLKALPLISREAGSNTQRLVDRVAAQLKIRLNYKFTLGSRELVKEAVAAGLGIGFVMSGEAGVDPRLHFMNLEQAEETRSDYLLYRVNDRHRKVITAMLQVLGGRYAV
ncbi:LysR substrate-binding domain-containing protein [Neptuniibacter halophilus]|uniref:LysR substrate-binding domain-containing protein n=1 Tax=Neptuniibacter halophilus TaxID=651666 RepID=UPI00257342E8|nr:LysR substrate-binding domain-containing protein [Neptuniibacter halophilus]